MKTRWVKFFSDEWIGGTIGLDNATRGLYITACALIYSHGGPITLDGLRDACSKDHGHAFNRQLQRLIDLGKLTINGEQISNKRSINELQSADKQSTKGQQNAFKRWNNNELEDASPLLDCNGNQNQNQNQNKERDKSLSPSAPPDRFEEFWLVCPRKVSKGGARKAYVAALRQASPDELIAGMRRYAEERAGEPQKYTAYPATWLNGARWLDQPAKANGAVRRPAFGAPGLA